jgi:predicted MFS family arabinose efflux permease
MLTVTTLAVLMAGTASSYWVLAVAFLVIGLTAVTAQILVPYAADLASDENRGRIVGKVFSGLLTGILLSRVLSSMLADVTSWRVVYLVSAALMTCLVIALRLALPPRQPTTGIPYGQLRCSDGTRSCAGGPTTSPRCSASSALSGPRSRSC